MILLGCQKLSSGSTVSILGKDRKILWIRDLKRKVEINDTQINVFSYRQDFSTLLMEGFKQYIYDFYYTTCSELSLKLAVKFSKISIRDTKSRWGSCSHKGALSFCWRLIFAPYGVAFYLAAHEVAHLKHMNHSVDFWQTVASLDADYKKSRNWLKQQGSLLFNINC